MEYFFWNNYGGIIFEGGGVKGPPGIISWIDSRRLWIIFEGGFKGPPGIFLKNMFCKSMQQKHRSTAECAKLPYRVDPQKVQSLANFSKGPKLSRKSIICNILQFLSITRDEPSRWFMCGRFWPSCLPKCVFWSHIFQMPWSKFLWCWVGSRIGRYLVRYCVPACFCFSG